MILLPSTKKSLELATKAEKDFIADWMQKFRNLNNVSIFHRQPPRILSDDGNYRWLGDTFDMWFQTHTYNAHFVVTNNIASTAPQLKNL